MEATELCFTPATELSRLIRTKELSPVELADAVLERIERLDPHPVGAVRHLRPEAVLRAGALLAERRPLRGALAQRPDGPHGARRGAAAAGIGRTRPARP